MLEGGGPGQDSGEKMVSLLERSLNHGFQLEDNGTFSSVLDSKRHLKRKKTPSYRRINSYFKSTKQYWRERNRRKQVKELRYVEFLSQKEIAAKLGISVSTVKRDLKKVERSVRGQLNRAKRLMQEEWRIDYEKAIEGLNLGEQLDYLSKLWEKHRKTFYGREYNRHVIKFFINLDMIQYDGFPTINMWPRYSRDLKLPYIFKFVCIKDGEKHELSPNVIIQNVSRNRVVWG